MKSYLNVFISNYIKENKRDRLTYELNSAKNQKMFMEHFCHETEKYVMEDKVVYHGKNGNLDNILGPASDIIFYVVTNEPGEGTLVKGTELQKVFNEHYMAVLAVSDDIVIIKEEALYSSSVFVLRI